MKVQFTPSARAQFLFALSYIRKDKPSETVAVSSLDELVVKTTEVLSEDMTDISFTLAFEYPYDGFPRELTVFFDTEYQEKLPYVSIAWLTPERIASFLDVTDLKADTQEPKLQKMVGWATRYGCASICVNPVEVDLLPGLLRGTAVKECYVIDFPLGSRAGELALPGSPPRTRADGCPVSSSS